jgi:FdrA protein
LVQFAGGSLHRFINSRSDTIVTKYKIIRNLYRDSVVLMQISSALAARPGVARASITMATEANLNLLIEAGMLQSGIASSPSDIIVVIMGEDTPVEETIKEAEAKLTQTVGVNVRDAGRPAPHSIEAGLQELRGANLALISTPGDYAAAEAFKALRLGLNVMLFSDNVAIEDEISLKACARRRNLMVMGPDCGTAIIDGVPLGFANAVRRGDIGLVAAAGTGLQQVTCLIERWGAGVSQAIGTGGRDLSVEVGGATMLQAILALAADDATKLITLISKPPAPAVAERLLAQASMIGKPVVVNFLGADPASIKRFNVHPVRTLEEAARAAVDIAKGHRPPTLAAQTTEPAKERVLAEVARLRPGQLFVRGLYSGGTLCYEALLLLSEALSPLQSNTPISCARMLADPWQSKGHTLVDLGDDAFTRGRPHPMIDNTLRAERIIREAHDPEVAIILFDLVLGYGAHRDPAPIIGVAVEAAQRIAHEEGRQIVFIGSVCGTEADPQGLCRQEARLREAGVRLADSNAAAVRLCASIIASHTGNASRLAGVKC